MAFIISKKLYYVMLKHYEKDDYLDYASDLWWANITMCDDIQDYARVGQEFNKFILSLPKNKYYDTYLTQPLGNTLLVTLSKADKNYYYAYHYFKVTKCKNRLISNILKTKNIVNL